MGATLGSVEVPWTVPGVFRDITLARGAYMTQEKWARGGKHATGRRDVSARGNYGVSTLQ